MQWLLLDKCQVQLDIFTISNLKEWFTKKSNVHNYPFTANVANQPICVWCLLFAFLVSHSSHVANVVIREKKTVYTGIFRQRQGALILSEKGQRSSRFLMQQSRSSPHTANQFLKTEINLVNKWNQARFSFSGMKTCSQMSS